MNRSMFIAPALIIALLWTSYGWAQSKKEAKKEEPKAQTQQAQQPQQGSDKMDLKQLEDKYWSAKDADYSVVQNRTYTKEKKYFFSLTYGGLQNDPYSSGRMTDFALGYYFNENHGLELSYESGSLSDGISLQTLKSTYAASPNYNRFVKHIGINYLWVPLYAKMSFLDKSIWYFDLQIGTGLGVMTYEHQLQSAAIQSVKTAPAFNLDISAQIFNHKKLAYRLDFKNKFSTQELKKYNGPVGADLGTVQQLDTTLLFGVTYFH